MAMEEELLIDIRLPSNTQYMYSSHLGQILFLSCSLAGKSPYGRRTTHRYSFAFLLINNTCMHHTWGNFRSSLAALQLFTKPWANTLTTNNNDPILVWMEAHPNLIHCLRQRL